MNKKIWLDHCIKNAVTCDENNIPLNCSILEKVKQRQKNDDLMIRRINMNTLFKKRTIKFSVMFVLIFMLLGSVIGVGAVTLLKTDKIDYPFVNDPQIIGKWQSVDFVKAVDEFNPGKKSWAGDLYLKELAFVTNGKMLVSINQGNVALAYSSLTWTKGKIINTVDKTASKYEIMEMNGSTYMFYEWKSGDYIIRGMQPQLYVLKKVDSNDYSKYETSRKIDNIDYPFVNDPQVLGKWNSVGFVKKVDAFDPDQKNPILNLYLTGLEFRKDGKLVSSTQNGDYSGGITWTKGLVLNPMDKTASAYLIKDISGSSYLFFEWKSGDYTLRGMEPYYYVLKKE